VFRVRDVDEGAVARLASALRVRPVTARCLAARGQGDVDAARGWLQPKLGGLRKPDGLAGFAVAVERLARAVTTGERIGVFGDYDVDGVTTAALLAQFLRDAGGDVIARVADRDAGYGFGAPVADALCDAGCGVIVTGDCGTSDAPAIAAARARGVDVIVVDHHTVPAAGAVHPALALVNPHRADSSFPFRGMASVGLAFYLAAAIRTRLDGDGWFKARPRPDVRDLLDLVALGTIADLVPLRGENRILAAAGLDRLAARPRPGIAALAAAAGIDPGKPLDARAVSWKLAPRLNAPGRLGAAAPSLELLLADEASAPARAAAVEECNAARRTAQDRVMEQAMAALDSDPSLADCPAIVLAARGWPPGVVGIVAAKLVDRTGKPAFVIGVGDDGVGRGSARAPDPDEAAGAARIDLYAALSACAPMLDRFGGHAGAAGLTVREDQVPALREALGAAVARFAEGSGPVGGPPCDAEVALADVDEPLCTELATLAPFGQDNAPPRLVARGLRVQSSRTVGDGTHLKLEVVDPRDARAPVRGAIAFGQAASDPGAGATIDLAFTPAVSEWKGARRVELEVASLVVSR
jgi:single-stranded-DNA-specific exonuclease